MTTNPSEDPRTEKSSSQDDRGLMPIWRLSSVGIEMGVAVFVGWLIGHYLDRWLHTDPWMMIVFLLLGVVAGFKGMIAAAREATADANRKSSASEKSKSKKEEK